MSDASGRQPSSGDREELSPIAAAATGQAGVRDLLRNPKVVVDAVAPTLIFAVLAATASVTAGSVVALGWCGLVIVYRLSRRQGLVHAMSGLGGVAVGVAVALLTGDAEAFFLPGIAGNVGFGLLCVVSVLLRRPAIAYTSSVLYRWPIGWYFHPRVRPAYSEITILWALYYLGKGLWQYSLVRADELAALATVRLVTGWPTLALLLVVTYAYVNRRLERLGGPGVDQWRLEQVSAAQAEA